MKLFVIIVSLMIFLTSTLEGVGTFCKDVSLKLESQPDYVQFLQGVGIDRPHQIVQKHSDSGTYIYMALFDDGTFELCEVYNTR